MPAVPRGAEDARISLLIRAGRISAISWAMKLPTENPRISAWPDRRAHSGDSALPPACTAGGGTMFVR